MRGGDLKRRITILRRAQTVDEGGGVATAWQTVKEAWASITPLSSSRTAFMRQAGLQATHQIVMRYDPDITSEMVIAYGPRRFRIEGMANAEEAGAELRLTAVEIGKDSAENL